jgi:uncharacterized protein
MASSNTVLIPGGTGLIGSALTEALIEKGYQCIILTRDPAKHTAKENLSYAFWDPSQQAIDQNAVRSTGAIINLAGANVAEKRWTESRKKELVESRVLAGKLLVKAIKEIPNSIDVVINASAIGWYGPDGDEPGSKSFTEELPAANDFLGSTCRQWEEAITPVTTMGKRLVILRTGIVLSTNGGAYPQMMLPLKFRTAAHFGNGRQVISWIHMEDLVRLYIFALENNEMNGVYNAVASQPVTNKQLIGQVAKERGGIFIPAPVPAPLLKIALGEMSVEVLKSATVSNKKVLDSGFQYLYPSIEGAVHKLEQG